MNHVRIVRPLLATWLLGFLLVVAAGCTSHTTTVLLVRHAERGTTGNDPPLTAAGLLRAQSLVAVAEQAGVSAIYVTEFQRTQQTAQPTAAALGLTPVLFAVGGDPNRHAQDLVADILANHAGHVVLVVGHSDTVPLEIGAFGASPAPTIGPQEFDRCFVIVKKDDEPARLVKARYGP